MTALLDRLGGLVVAFSGSVDSAVVLAAAVQALGTGAVLGTIVDSPSLARAELATARYVAGQLGVELVVLCTDELADPDYRANADDRCYFCKQTVLAAVRGLAQRRGFAHVATSTHPDDRRASHRPGLRAAELGVREPLAEVGAIKQVVRVLAAHWNLTVRDKPSTPCLASRIAVGVPGDCRSAGTGGAGGAGRQRLPRRASGAGARPAGTAAGRGRVPGRARPGSPRRDLRTGLLAQAVAAGLRGEGDLARYHSGSLSG